MYSSLSFSWYSRGCFQNGARRLQGQIWSNKATVGCARAGVSLPGWKKRGSGHEQGKRTRLCEVNKLLDTIHYTHIGSPTSVTLSVLRFISCSYNILVFPHRSLRCTLAVYCPKICPPSVFSFSARNYAGAYREWSEKEGKWFVLNTKTHIYLYK